MKVLAAILLGIEGDLGKFKIMRKRRERTEMDEMYSTGENISR